MSFEHHTPSRRIKLRKIVSGGQTGVDRGAFDAALELGLEHGGWCPMGRLAEDGVIPNKYNNLMENDATEYSVRTEQNVADSDGTLIMFRNTLFGGTQLTLTMADKHNKPHFLLDLNQFAADTKICILTWLVEKNIQVLNCAGPRESECPGISSQAKRTLFLVLS